MVWSSVIIPKLKEKLEKGKTPQSSASPPHPATLQAGKTSLESEFVTSANAEVLAKLHTSVNGLTEAEAAKRLAQYGHNELAKKKERSAVEQFFARFLNPLVIVLLVIALVSFSFKEYISALLVTGMAFISVVLSFLQEYHAGKEAEKLREMIHVTATVLRDGKHEEISISDVVPGDIVDLRAGDMIPADVRVLSGKDLFINQSTLTGEAFPVEKVAGPLPESKSFSPSDTNNIAFMGSSVVSGSASAVVIKTGLSTQFGELSKKLTRMRIETSFDKGIKSFTWVMIKFMLVLVLIIFVINALLKGDVLQAFLFSIAVAIGVTPEMLPMIVSVNLSKGAINMAKKQVIVKRLNSIQNFGAMDVLCTDKTGTLTLNSIVLELHLDLEGNDSEDVLRLGYINSFYQTGLKNLLDEAILKHEAMLEKILPRKYRKVDEIPFDFTRKLMSVVVESEGKAQLVAKGAPEEIFQRCNRYETQGAIKPFGPEVSDELRKEYIKLSEDGFRVLAVAWKDIEQKKPAYGKEDECNLVLRGYLAFLDPPKETAKEAVESLKKLNIDFKILTGDNELVTMKICSQVGIEVKGLATGHFVDKQTDDELRETVRSTNIFVRLSPGQKERVIRALQANNHVVGYMGDGINDAPALKTADVGISVDNAVDIARESADIILLKKSLLVVKDGVIEGRKTFGNIVKYIKMGASSNLGNMISMTGASLFLPFLPMLPIQVLFNNFLYDLSQVAIPTDAVDEDYTEKPRPWNIRGIRKFMMIIGPISSIFDFLTFAVMWFIFHAQESLFHTGWFIESLCTQTLVIYVIRTGKIPFIESWPSKTLIATSVAVIIIGIAIPLSPLGKYLGFVAPPMLYFLILAGMIVTYLLLVQLVKTWFIKKYGYL